MGNCYFKENLRRLSFVSVDRGRSQVPDTGLPISQRCTTEVNRLEKVHHRGTETGKGAPQRYRDWKRCNTRGTRVTETESWRNRGQHKFGLKTAQQWRRSALKPCRVDADVLITAATTTKTYIVTN